MQALTLEGIIMATYPYQVFATVAEAKTYYRAAELLNLTPSAVSHSITQLENDLGFPLFIRNRNGSELTPNGAQILPYVREILNAENRLHQEVDSINGLLRGTLRIGAFSSASMTWLPKILKSFRQKYPEITIQLIQGSLNDIAERLRQGQLDIGFTALPVDEHLITYPLINDELFTITPKEFVPANADFVTEDDIHDKTFILQEADYERAIKTTLDQYNVTQNSLAYTIDDPSIIAMVESGLGFGIMPALTLESFPNYEEKVNVYHFDKDVYRTLVVATPKTQNSAPAVKALLNEVTSFMATQYNSDKLL
jgi:DNA-binding transcriptional LysR family regulator